MAGLLTRSHRQRRTLTCPFLTVIGWTRRVANSLSYRGGFLPSARLGASGEEAPIHKGADHRGAKLIGEPPYGLVAAFRQVAYRS